MYQSFCCSGRPASGSLARYALTEAELIVQRQHYILACSGHSRFAPVGLDQIQVDTELLQTDPVPLIIDAVMMQRLFIPDRVAWPVDDNEEYARLRAHTPGLG